MDYTENFVSNLKTKDELRKIFIENYNYIHGSTVDTIGMPMDNIGDRICYFISAFNIVSRLQCTIYFEIDNLCEIAEINRIREKVRNDECVITEEAKCFNKYLLIQTIIESQKPEYRNNLLSRVNFIQSRLHAYLFDENKFNSEELIIKSKIDDIIKILGDMEVDLTFFEDYTYNDPDLYMKLQRYYSYEKFTSFGDTPGALDAFIRDELDQWITGIEECIRGLEGAEELEANQSIDQEILKQDINGMRENLNRILVILNSIRRREGIVPCTNSGNNLMNRQIKIEQLGLTIDDLSPSGSLSAVPLKLFLEDINISGSESALFLDDSEGLVTLRGYDRPDGHSYIIVGAKQIPIEKIGERLKEYVYTNYIFCGASWNCGGSHSVVSLCYSEKCERMIHTFVNETRRIEKEITQGYTGHLCYRGITSELLIFENRNCIARLIDAIYQFVRTNTELTIPNVHGGSINYYDKYIKYKNKYIELKKKLKK